MNKMQVAKYFEVKPAAVVRFREVDEGATLRALVDYGIGGIKVHYVPIEEFTPPKPKPEPDLLPAIDLNYRDLQERAKDAGIPANQKADDLRFALSLEEEE
jgi:hypothetical protein